MRLSCTLNAYPDAESVLSQPLIRRRHTQRMGDGLTVRMKDEGWKMKDEG